MPTQQSIDMFTKRVERWPDDYASRTILGELLLRQAAQEDNLPAYAAAREMFAAAKRINPNYKPALLGAAKVLMAQHQFADALQEIIAAVPPESQRPTELALIVDCHLDMGNLDKAKIALDQLSKLETSPPVDARLARFAELCGDRERAVQLIESALQTIRRGSSIDDDRHWYQWRLAGLAFDSGKLNQAEQLTREILEESPADHRAKILLARIEFSKNRTTEAIELLKDSVSVNPTPPTLAMLGDLYCHQNDVVRAKKHWESAEEIIREEAVVAKAAHAREAAIFFADHDRYLTEALDLIVLDRKQRQDLQTVDAHVWILYKNKHLVEALRELKDLLKHDPSDLMICYHATKIYQANGQFDEAKKHLQKIVNINPRFSFLHANDIANLQTEWNLTPQR